MNQPLSLERLSRDVMLRVFALLAVVLATAGMTLYLFVSHDPSTGALLQRIDSFHAPGLNSAQEARGALHAIQEHSSHRGGGETAHIEMPMPIALHVLDRRIAEIILQQDEYAEPAFAATTRRVSHDYETLHTALENVGSEDPGAGTHTLQVADALSASLLQLQGLHEIGIREARLGVTRSEEAEARATAYVLGPLFTISLILSALLLFRLRQLLARGVDIERALVDSERLYATLAESSPVGILRRDEHGEIVYANARAMELTGLSMDGLRAGHWSLALHPDDRDRVVAMQAKLVSDGLQVEGDHRFVLPTGQSRWVHVVGVALTDSEGKRTGYLFTATDISARKEAEQREEEIRREMEEQRAQHMHSDRLRSLGEMATGIAHDLNQPLMGVSGVAENLLISLERGWDLSDDEWRRELSRLIEQSERMKHIVEHIRNFARQGDSGDAGPVDVNEAISNSLELIGPQLRSRGIEIECTLAADLPTVHANLFSLEEVMINLLTNARDATQARPSKNSDAPPPIEVQTYTSNGRGSGHVVIEVKDRGAGIPDAIRERVFEPFFTTKGADEGTGLGLAISKSLVEEWHGRLEIRSVAGEGTSIYVYLPAIDTAQDPPHING